MLLCPGYCWMSSPDPPVLLWTIPESKKIKCVIFLLNIPYLFLPVMLKPVVQGNIPVLISIDRIYLYLYAIYIFIFVLLHRKLFRHLTVSGFMKIWTLKAAIYLWYLSETNTFATQTNSNCSDFMAKRFTLTECAHSFQPFKCHLF